MSESGIFKAAVKLPPDRRAAYLDQACGSDAELRAEIESLLHAHDTSCDFLENVPAGPDPTEDYQPIAERPGTVIGPYKLMEQIGEGGFGLVFVAEQQHPIRRKVALKIIKPGMDTRDVIARFEAERQALALMDHPNIATLFDAGVTKTARKSEIPNPKSEGNPKSQVQNPKPERRNPDGDDAAGTAGPDFEFRASNFEFSSNFEFGSSDLLIRTPGFDLGRPYFVMELVRGISIIDYCDSKRLTTRDRLELFVSVCQAVQHAHSKGIIHRDLKPSNILVASHDGAPVVKVIDFGVVKAIGQQLTDKTIYTRFAQMIGTPLYMSPEQVELNALDVDIRSDVYSLGVLLYELLTGTTPFDRQRLATASFDEMRRIIKEEEPPTPSRRLSSACALGTIASARQTEPAKLTKLVRGELDWIVMKALEKDRGRRYQTANGLAMDVQRYLAGEQVQAVPPSVGYRLRKFVRRNKGPVLTAGLVFLALVGGVIGTTWGLVREERARKKEQGQRRAAEAAADRALKAQERAEQGFTKAKEAVEHYLRAVTDDPDLKHQHDLHPLRKKLLEAAVPFYGWFTEQKPGEAALEAERGRAYLRLAAVRHEMGEAEAARKGYERTLAIFADLAADSPAVPEYRQFLARSHYSLGRSLRDLEQRPAAERAYRRAVDLQEKLAADFPSVPEYRFELARSHISLGLLLMELGQWPAAERALRLALELHEKLAADFPSVADYRIDLSRSHMNLGVLLYELGQRPAAGRAYRRAADLQEKLAADFPTVPEYRLELAGIHNNLGLLLADLGKWPAAERDYRRAIDLQEKLVADFPTVPVYRQSLATMHNNLGTLLLDVRQWPAAEQAYRRSLELREKLAADSPTVPVYRLELARSHYCLGTLLKDLAQRPAAERALRRALDVQEKLAADSPTVQVYGFDLARSHNSLGLLLKDLGQRPAAERAHRRALDVQEKLAADFPTVPVFRVDVAGTSVNLGNLLRDEGQAEARLPWYAKAIALLEPLVRQEPLLVTERSVLRQAHWGRADALHGLGRYADAVKDWDRALALGSDPGRELDHRPASRNSAGTPLALGPDPGRELDLRCRRAVSLARAGEHAKAVAEANALAAAKDVDSGTLYNVACVCAIVSSAVKDANIPGAGATRLAETYSTRAVELLQQAVAKGYKEAALMKKEKELDALRDREDFKRLVGELEAKED
jgi:serine/threonine protein kinase/tetratricopeptide (TPR) repeat protein